MAVNFLVKKITSFNKERNQTTGGDMKCCYTNFHLKTWYQKGTWVRNHWLIEEWEIKGYFYPKEWEIEDVAEYVVKTEWWKAKEGKDHDYIIQAKGGIKRKGQFFIKKLSSKTSKSLKTEDIQSEEIENK